MKKPRKSGPRRRRKSPDATPACLEHDSFLVQALFYEPLIDPRHVLTPAEQGVVACNEATLHRSDLTAEEAGDALLAITETKQLRVRVRNFGGAVVDELQLPTLGLALLLEGAMRRRMLRRQAGGAAPANHQQAGTDAASLPTCSAPPTAASAERGAHQPSATVLGMVGKSPAARLCALAEEHGLKVCAMSLSPSDARQLEYARAWLGLGSWSQALAELGHITPLLLGHPDVMELRLQIYAHAGEWDHAWHLGLVLINLVPDRVESWLATAHAARHATRGGPYQAYRTLLFAIKDHPNNWLVSFKLACCAYQRGDMGEGDWWLGKAGDQGGGKALQALAVTEPDMEPLRQFLLQQEVEKGATDKWLE